MTQEEVRRVVPKGVRRPWPWKATSILFLVSLVLLAGLAAVPIRSTSQIGVDSHSFTTTNRSFDFFWPRDLAPSAARCANLPSAGPQCSAPWVALNWSTTNGKNMTFEFGTTFMGASGVVGLILYEAQNLSFGGYTFSCATGPLCYGQSPFVQTNGTLGQEWTLGWELVYTYPTVEPLI